MKSHVKFYQMAVLSLCFLITFSLVRRLFYTVTAIRYITFSFDSQLSQTVCDAIKKQVTLFEMNGLYNPEAIIENIPHVFTMVKSLDIKQFPTHMALVTITAFDPIIRINDDRLLIENQSILSTDYYAVYKIESLQKINIAMPIPAYVSSSIMAAMKQCLAEKIFDHYTVYFVNEHEWYLGDTKDPLFTLCCDAASLPIDMVRMTYNRLKNQIKKRGPAKVKWVADVRFGDQIILSMDKGGRYG